MSVFLWLVESDPPFEDKRQFGHSRDKRRDCVQVVIALVVTPHGFPLAYEVMAGNTSDNTTLADFLTKIEDQYGRSDRVWIMDRGIPTEQTLEAMREGDTPVRYLVGTPKGRLTRLEKSFLEIPWQEVRQSVDVKLLTNDGELFVLVRSERRVLRRRIQYVGERLRCGRLARHRPVQNDVRQYAHDSPPAVSGPMVARDVVRSRHVRARPRNGLVRRAARMPTDGLPPNQCPRS